VMGGLTLEKVQSLLAQIPSELKTVHAAVVILVAGPCGAESVNDGTGEVEVHGIGCPFCVARTVEAWENGVGAGIEKVSATLAKIH